MLWTSKDFLGSMAGGSSISLSYIASEKIIPGYVVVATILSFSF